MPKFKVVLTYTNVEVVEVEAESEEAAFNKAVLIEPANSWGHNLLDYEVYEVE